MLHRLRRGEKKKGSTSKNEEATVGKEPNISGGSAVSSAEIDFSASIKESESHFGLFELWPNTPEGKAGGLETVLE